jgi:hypothetical protein
VFSTYLALQGYFYSLLVFILTVLFSYLSYIFIEKKQIKPNKIIGCVIMSIIFAFASYKLPMNQYFIDKKIQDLAIYGNIHWNEIKEQLDMGKCYINSKSDYENYDEIECLTLSDTLKNVLLIGDSHASMLSSSLRKKVNSRNENFLQANVSGAKFELNPEGKSFSVDFVKYILYDFIPKNGNKIDMVIISNHWLQMRVDSKKELKQKTLDLIDYLQDAMGGGKVKIIGQTEMYSIPFPSICAREIIFNKDLHMGFIDKKALEFNLFLKSFIPDEIYIDVYDISGINKFGKYNNQYVPYMYDNNHLTNFGAEQIIDYASKKGLFN